MHSVDELREAFYDAGISVSDWARDHGFRPENVYAVLAGRAKGRRGESHRIAQALGLKAKADQALLKLLGDAAATGEPVQAGSEARTKTEEGAPMS
jgi:gp16 family phage-associated protein